MDFEARAEPDYANCFLCEAPPGVLNGGVILDLYEFSLLPAKLTHHISPKPGCWRWPMKSKKSPSPQDVVPGIVLCTPHAMELVPEPIQRIFMENQLFQELKIGRI